MFLSNCSLIKIQGLSRTKTKAREFQGLSLKFKGFQWFSSRVRDVVVKYFQGSEGECIPIFLVFLYIYKLYIYISVITYCILDCKRYPDNSPPTSPTHYGRNFLMVD